MIFDINKEDNNNNEKLKKYIFCSLKYTNPNIELEEKDITIKERKEDLVHGLLIRLGTKSKIFRIITLERENGKVFARDYILKIYGKNGEDMTNSEALEHYAIERAVLSVNSKLEKKIYPELLSFSDKDYFLLMRYSLDKNLEKMLDEGANVVKTISDSLNPVCLHHDCLINYKEDIEKEIKEIRNCSDKKIDGLQVLDEEYFSKNIKKYQEILNGFLEKGIKDKISEKIPELCENLTKKEDYTSIRKDGYPWQNKVDNLVDAGSVCIGSRALDLGCLIGYPTIFNKLNDGQFDLIIGDYCSKVKALNNNYNPDKHEFKRKIYSGAIFGNLREAAGLVYYKELGDAGRLSENLSTIKNQIELLNNAT